MLNEFRGFFSNLPGKVGYCVGCLGDMYDKPLSTIWGYLIDDGLLGRPAECDNCGKSTVTSARNHRGKRLESGRSTAT